MYFSVSPMHATCQAHFSLLYLTTVIMYGGNTVPNSKPKNTQVEDDPRQDGKIYVGHLESKERLRIQPAQLFNFS